MRNRQTPDPGEIQTILNVVETEHGKIEAEFDRLRREAPAFDAEHVDRLEQTLCTHFEREEELMRSVGYPAFDRHRQAHFFVLEQLRRYVDLTARHPGQASGENLIDFVTTMVHDHIASEDDALMQHLSRIIIMGE